MADRIVTAEEADRTPNWNKWRLIPYANVLQCVALSLNIDPDRVKVNKGSWMVGEAIFVGSRDSRMMGEAIKDESQSQEFRDRAEVVLANLLAGALGEGGKNREVNLRRFAAWVGQVRWTAPAELLAMADEHDPGETKTPTTAAKRAHNKRDTEARNHELRERMKQLKARNTTASHFELCRMLKEQLGSDLDAQTIRRITG